MNKYILTDEENRKVSKAISYLKKLEGTKRKDYSKNTPPKRGAPFWIEKEKLPNVELIKKEGSVCVGFTNLVRRLMKLEIPGDITGKKKKDWVGGTEAWFDYLKKEKRLEKIDFNKVYPKGTLLLHNFNPKDQGHVAVTINSSKLGLLNSKIIHNTNEKNINLYGTYIHKLKEYENYKRFTHICLPQDWILKN